MNQNPADSGSQIIRAPRPPGINRWALPWAAALLVLGMAVSGLVHQTLSARQLAKFHDRFAQSTREFIQQLQEKMSHYGPGIGAVRSLFLGSAVQRVTLQTFHNFATEINLVEDFPAATGIGYAAVVSAAKTADFEKEVKSLGRANFRIQNSAGSQDPMLLIQYLEPEFDHAEAIGTDLAAVAQRREAAWRAIERNQPVLSQSEPTDAGTRPGAWFTLLVPVYQSKAVVATAEQRRQSARGVVFIPLNLQSIFEELRQANPELQISLSDARQGQVFFDSDDVRSSSGLIKPFETEINLFGSQWRVRIQADKSVEELLGTRDIAITTAVVMVSSVLAALALFLLLSNVDRRRQAAWANARLAAIVESVDEAIVAQDLSGRITSWNKAAQSLFGHSAKQALGRQFHELVSSDMDIRADLDHLALAQLGQNPPSVSWNLAVPGQQVKSILMSVSAVHDETGALSGYARIMRDMSAQQQLETELREAHKMQAIGQLTGGLAHDFNNLLSVILGNLENLQISIPKSDQQAQQSLEAAQLATQRGADVARSLLSMAHRQNAQTSAHDLHELLAHMIPLLRSAAGAKVSIQTRLSARPVPVRIDPSGLSNAVLNLVSNARDAGQGRTQITVTLSTHLHAGADGAAVGGLPRGHYVELQVHDNGPGMSSEVAARAFEPLFTTKALGQGTGLGLAMVMNFAKQMGGNAQIDSVPGQGTSVRLWLPVDQEALAAQQASGRAELKSLPDQKGLDAPAEAALDAPTQSSAESPEASAAQGRLGGRMASAGLRAALVVDDEPELLRLAADWLQDMGFEVVACANADDALQALAQRPFALLFTDIILPGQVDGVALARQAHTRWPDLPILLASGYSGIHASGPALPGPLLPKPYRRKDLQRAVQSLVPGA